jgi:molybdopterin-guanine dinucleotide biosynthesis protein A
MGTNKALLHYEGVPLVRRAAERARCVTDEVFVCANDPELYSFLGMPVIQDRFPGCGPLAGLHAALYATRRKHVLLLACDLPNVTGPLLTVLAASATGFDAVIPVTSDGCQHPLCAVYSRSCLSAVEQNLQRGRFRMLDLFENTPLRVRLLPSNEIHFHDSLFDNLNTPDDLKKSSR